MNAAEETRFSKRSFIIQLIYPDVTGIFARIAETIGNHGGDVGQIDVLGSNARLRARGISFRARDEWHAKEIVQAVRRLDKVRVVDVWRF